MHLKYTTIANKENGYPLIVYRYNRLAHEQNDNKNWIHKTKENDYRNETCPKQ